MLSTRFILLLLLAGPCFAATSYVNLTASSFVPPRLIIQDGDVVVWKWNLGAGCHNVIDTGSDAYPPTCGSVSSPSFCSANETNPETCTFAAATECLDSSTFTFRFFLVAGTTQKNFTYVSAPNCGSEMYGQITVNSVPERPTNPPLSATPAPTCAGGDCNKNYSRRSPWVWAGIALMGLVVLLLVVIAILILVKCCQTNTGKRH